MKNMKMHTKLIVGFLITEIIVLLALAAGYSTARTIIATDNPQHYLDSYGIFSIAAAAVATLIIGYTSVTLIRSLRRSMETLSAAAAQIAEGKVDVDLEKSSNDEFGEVIGEYQTVVDNIRYQAHVAEEVADGNLLVDVVPKSKDDLLGNSLKQLVSRNRHALSSIGDAVRQVSSGASQVAAASEALAEGSTEQASAIEQITASINDIAGKTMQNAEGANRAAELAQQTITDVQKGNTQMHGMMDAMQQINEASENISRIIKVIDDIAFQTNILALNAAVEAARAGEAGKGFAVVAEEVRNLAAKSASAAAETAEMIEDSIHKAEAGSQIADETAKALEMITQAVRESEALIRDIADASNYQATAITQINQAVEQVAQVVQTNSATSEQCAAASAELSDQANRMQKLLAVYKLGNGVEMTAGRDAAEESGQTVQA